MSDDSADALEQKVENLRQVMLQLVDYLEMRLELRGKAPPRSHLVAAKKKLLDKQVWPPTKGKAT